MSVQSIDQVNKRLPYPASNVGSAVANASIAMYRDLSTEDYHVVHLSATTVRSVSNIGTYSDYDEAWKCFTRWVR